MSICVLLIGSMLCKYHPHCVGLALLICEQIDFCFSSCKFLFQFSDDSPCGENVCACAVLCSFLKENSASIHVDPVDVFCIFRYDNLPLSQIFLHSFFILYFLFIFINSVYSI